ncbi:DUF4835 family protein [candidate division KSB1 bacterium]|nr:DUF4835 family protein [candidate division KSB1 bacterium]
MNKKRFIKVKWILLFILFFSLSFPLYAQIIEGRVTTKLESLPIDKQQKMADFAEKVTHYINSNTRNDNTWNTEVFVDMELILQDISSGAEEKYDAEILIHNNYDIQFFDRRWRFAYQSGDILTYNENVLDSFTSLIEFYLNLILGGEYDKWGTLAGTLYYEKARNIAEQSKFGLARYQDGWDQRLELVNYLLSDRHKPFREMVDYYFYGLSFVKEDNEKARKHISTAIKMLDKILANDPDNEYAKTFLKAHHIELVEIYRRAINKEPVRTLLVIDPDNETIYRELLEN